MAHSSDVPLVQWALDMRGRMTKKRRRVARMAPAFKETRKRGFGLRIRKTQFTDYDMNRVSRLLKPLEEPLGIWKIRPGKNKDVFWTYDTMAEQVVDVMDMMGSLHPDLQLVFPLDWSSGHEKKQDGRLTLLQMNTKY